MHRRVSNSGWRELALGVVVGVVVCWPWMHGGRLWLLDWVVGPHDSALTRSGYGLDGGVGDGVPLHALVAGINAVLGSASTWLPVFAFFPIAVCGAGRLARMCGGDAAAGLVSGLFFAVNPFVLDRLYAGQIGFLLGCGLLPHFVVSAVRNRPRGWSGGLATGLLVAALVGVSIHFLVLCSVVLVALTVIEVERRRSAAWLLMTALIASACSAYVVVTSAAAGRAAVVPSNLDLRAFATRGGSGGPIANLLGLYGFWRPNPVDSRSAVSAWWLLLIVLGLVAVVGLIRLLRGDSKRLGSALLTAGIVGLFGAAGSAGPTGPLFHWLYVEAPPLRIMREPQKLAVLYAVLFSVCLGLGLQALAQQARGPWARRAAALLLAGVAVAYTPLLFDGLDGHVRTTTVPDSWRAADRLIRSDGGGAVLALPWHQYMSFPETGGRVIMNPLSTVLAGRVITSDEPESGTQADASISSFARSVHTLDEVGPTTRRAGRLVANLGAAFVVLVSGADASTYGWLDQQQDLSLVLRGQGIRVYRVNLPPGQGVAKERSPVHYVGQAQNDLARIVVPEPADSGWRSSVGRLEPTSSGALQIPPSGRLTQVLYAPWPEIRAGYMVSALAAGVTLIGIALCVRLRGVSHK